MDFNAEEAIGRRFGNFEVLENPDGGLHLLGGGGFGKTYKARHVYLDQIVALKVINERFLHDASAKERFLREAKVVHKLRHPRIAHVVDFGEVKHSLYYAMEFCGGGNLEHMVSRLGPVNLPVALRCAWQLAEALGCAHSHGFIHRDVKPANVMLTGSDDDDPQLKLVDFGLVKHLRGEASEATQALTVTGQQYFTIQFASPEQLMEEELDARSDIFALGMTIWFLLNGAAPETGSIGSIVARRIDSRSYEPQLPVHLPPAYRAILARLLEKEPNSRFQNINEVLAAFAAAEAVAHLSSEAPVEAGGEVRTDDDGGGSSIPQVEPRTLEEFCTIREQIGSMPLGMLYRATLNRDGEQVAVTMISESLCTDPAQLETIEKNARILMAHPHEAIAEVCELTCYPEGLALVQEWHRGISLRRLLKSARLLPYASALRVLQPMAEGIDWTIRQGLPGVVLALDEIYVQPVDTLASPPVAALIDTPLGNWPPFRVRLLPYVIREDISYAWGVTANTDQVADPTVAFASILYHLVAGHPTKSAARSSRTAYITTGRLTEESNRLLAACIASEQVFGGCAEILRAVNACEGVNFPAASSRPSTARGLAGAEQLQARGSGSTTSARSGHGPAAGAEEVKPVGEAHVEVRPASRDVESAPKSPAVSQEGLDAARRISPTPTERARKIAEETERRKSDERRERAEREAEQIRLKQEQAELAQAKKIADKERAEAEARERRQHQLRAEEERAQKAAEAKRLASEREAAESARVEAEKARVKQQRAEAARAKKLADEERAAQEARDALLRKQEAEAQRAILEAAKARVKQQQAEVARAKKQANEERAAQEGREAAARKQAAEAQWAVLEAEKARTKRQSAEKARAKKLADEERAAREASEAAARKQEAEAQRALLEAEKASIKQQEAEEARAKKLQAALSKEAGGAVVDRIGREAGADSEGKLQRPSGVRLLTWSAVALVAIGSLGYLTYRGLKPPEQDHAVAMKKALLTPPGAAPHSPVPSAGEFVFAQGINPDTASVVVGGHAANPKYVGEKAVVSLAGVKSDASIIVAAPGYESQVFPISGDRIIRKRVILKRLFGFVEILLTEGGADYATAVFTPVAPLAGENVPINDGERRLGLTAGTLELLPTGIYSVMLLGPLNAKNIEPRMLVANIEVRQPLTHYPIHVPPSYTGRYTFDCFAYVQEKVVNFRRTLVLDQGLQGGHVDDVYEKPPPGLNTPITDITIDAHGELHGVIRFSLLPNEAMGYDEQFKITYTDGRFMMYCGGWDIKPKNGDVAAKLHQRFPEYKFHFNPPTPQPVAKN